MKKVEIEFNEKTIITMVEMGFAYNGIKGKSASRVYTNLIQVLVPIDEEDLLPDWVRDRPVRNYRYNGKKLADIEDITYNMKYIVSNGKYIQPGYIRSYMRLLEIQKNLGKPEIIDKVLEVLK